MSPRDELFGQGFTRFPAVLPLDFLAALQAVCDRLLAAGDHDRFRAQGSMLPTTLDPLFADLIVFPPALACLAALGFPDPSFSDGYVISKPGGGPRLFWHYDWFAWDDPRSFENPPPQVFLMWYLADTTRENGCLRAIPGSHLVENSLHRLLSEPHAAALSQGNAGPEFSDRPDEVDVPVQAGDLLVGDARLLHAAHANQTATRRTLITLWYQPDLGSLPGRMQAQMAAKSQRLPSDWPEAARAKLLPRMASARYPGNEAPCGRQLWRPGS